jgi:hypothetical protein
MNATIDRHHAIRRPKMNNDYFRVTDVWTNDGSDSETVHVDLDYQGDDDGNDAATLDIETFAVLAGIMALQKPTYYSKLDQVITTEPFYAQREGDQQNQMSGKVIELDAVWRLTEKTGTLFVILNNRARGRVDINSAAAFTSWMLAASVHQVTFVNGRLTDPRQN